MSSEHLFFLIIFFSLCTCKGPYESDFLYRVTDPVDPEVYGYANSNGDIVIPLGKYPMVYTDTLKTYAIVLIPEKGLMAIDRYERELFEVFPFDNGPDEPNEGLFRIIKNNKIGFANTEGTLVIPPAYQCAYPFKNGKAKVSLQCTKKSVGEHISWESESWFYINRLGNRSE